MIDFAIWWLFTWFVNLGLRTLWFSTTLPITVNGLTGGEPELTNEDAIRKLAGRIFPTNALWALRLSSALTCRYCFSFWTGWPILVGSCFVGAPWAAIPLLWPALVLSWITEWKSGS